ncbi:MAG: phage major capsid protein [Frankiales bacterium]|nr:phage major capsid protein [Frankiales bacterium]
MAGINLSAVAPTLLPPQITGPIFTKATETSAVMNLARRVPLAVNAQTAIPVPMDVPTAGWVSEGAAKPVSSSGVGVKIMTGKKLALLIPVSQEVAMTNAAGLYEQLSNDLPTALARAFDAAAIRNVDLASGGAGPFGTANGLANTPNAQVIGATSAANGGVYADLWKGVQTVLNGNVPYEVTGFAADPRLKPEAALSVDSNGRPIFVDSSFNANSATNASTLIGYPTYFNSAISGKLYRQTGSTWTVTINGSPTGGTFTISVGGYTTSAIAYNANAATVQTAIRALGTGVGTGYGSDIAASGATVSGSGPYAITLSAPAPVYADGSSLTGGSSPSATVAQTTQTDSGLRAIGGDWGQAAYGVGMDISIKVSNQASYTPDGGTTWVSAFQNNLVLLLAEAYFGWVVNDLNAFVKYTHAAGS